MPRSRPAPVMLLPMCRPAAPALLAALVLRSLDSRAAAREAAVHALDSLPASCPTDELLSVLAGGLQVCCKRCSLSLLERGHCACMLTGKLNP